MAASTLPSFASSETARRPFSADAAGSCLAISSANGIASVAVARALVLEKAMRPVSAAVRGVASVEADENDM